jgi:hypothetical protein
MRKAVDCQGRRCQGRPAAADVDRLRGGGFGASCNGQLSVDEAAHISVATELINNASDARELPKMLEAVKGALGADLETTPKPPPMNDGSWPTHAYAAKYSTMTLSSLTM